MDCLQQHFGRDAVSLIVDRRTAALAILMAGPERTTAIPIEELQRLVASSSSHVELRAAATATIALAAGCSAGSAINLNYHPLAALLLEAIDAGHKFGPRIGSVLKSELPDAVLAPLFDPATRSRSDACHLSDLWLDYAAGDYDRSRFRPLELPEELILSCNGWLASESLDESNEFIVILPGAGLPARHWPVESWASVIDSLAVDRDVVLVGSEREIDTTRKIVTQIQTTRRRVIDLCGRTDIGLLAAILKRARLVIGTDTGPLHIAAMVGTPVLGLYYGSMFHRQTGPYGNGHWVLTPVNVTYPVSECELERHPELYRRQLRPDDVAAAAYAFLSGRFPALSDRVRLLESHLSFEGLDWIDITSPRIAFPVSLGISAYA